jgi:hypothetical protein
MNNEFLTVINYLKGLLQNDDDVQVVTHGVSNDIDLDDNGNYPLAHIQFLSFNPAFQQGMISFLFEVHILKIRNVNPVPSTDKWLRNDNELDNYNLTVAISNRLISRLNDQNTADIDLVSQTTPQAISLQFMNMLDGCNFQIELAITNQVDVC